MNNYVSKWRIWAKIVAIIDLLLLVLLLSSLIYFVAIKIPKTTFKTTGVHTLTWTRWASIVILFIQSLVGLWAVVQLLRATKLGRQPNEANKLTQFWENLGYATILLSIVHCFIGVGFYFKIFTILIRIIFICIVSGFKREVEAIINTASPQKV